jgi:hypothetical protein
VGGQQFALFLFPAAATTLLPWQLQHLLYLLSENVEITKNRERKY